ncbi:fumarylacetoacetate hydrolase family protein [Nocardia sp. R6R-6]|uniref:fumarylacetoacetate hydrolase family protein n=1 Tax=Nocardia sp. R6R-6 TaxID=3459303 RepID=UPI00403E289E
MVVGEVADTAAARLRAAARTGVACEPVRDLIGADDLQAAYAVQQRLTQARLASGATIVGRKIGLTSEAVQRQLGVDQPDFGILFSGMEYPEGAHVPFGAFLQPRVEAEIAFVLAADLADGELNLDQVREAVNYATAAIEICDSRVADWDIRFADTVADNASAGGYVLGGTRLGLDELTPRDVEMSMTVTGQDDSVGSGAACLGDPLLALQWLARTARDLGDPLRAGQVVLSGALGPMRSVVPGAEVVATISGLGSVTVRFDQGDSV